MQALVDGDHQRGRRIRRPLDLTQRAADELSLVDHEVIAGVAVVDTDGYSAPRVTDAELIGRCRAGDQTAWEALVRRPTTR
jgi:hypothetical protein